MNRLLVIEDHPWVLRVLCDAFRRSGAHIESATTLRSARERILADDPYDVVICEQSLSDGNGLELLGWLRWQQQIAVPFLLITRSEHVDSCEAGFSSITRPFGTEELLASLNRLLRSQAQGIITRQIPFAAAAE